MERVYAFTAESGTDGFNFEEPECSKHFMVTALIVDEYKLNQVTAEMEEIWQNYSQLEEWNSAVALSHSIRARLLSELLPLDFKIFTIVVDKRKIKEDSGLLYPSSFYKFVNNLLHNELRSAFIRLSICAEAREDSAYMQSFIDYVRQHEDFPDLFGEREFYFVDSKNSSLLRMASFVSDCLAFSYERQEEGEEKSEDIPEYARMLDKKIIRIENWPKDLLSYTFDKKAKGQDFNQQIADICFKQAQAFIRANELTKDEDTHCQLLVLKYLCFRFVNKDYHSYITTNEILSSLKYRTPEKISVHYFRSRIIAKLRDAGVIIASCSRGYKIPSTEDELYDFINHGSSFIMPMLERLKKCRDIIHLGTMGELDLFDHLEFENLKKYFESKSAVTAL